MDNFKAVEASEICALPNDQNHTWSYHKDELKRLLWRGLPGAIVGFVLSILILCFMCRSSDEFNIWLPITWVIVAAYFVLLFSSFPYGWGLLNRFLGRWEIFGNIWIIILLFLLRAGVAFLIGRYTYPFLLLYHLIHSQKSKKRIRKTWVILAVCVIGFALLLWLLYMLIG